PTMPTLIVGYGNMGTRHARVVRSLGGDGAVWGVVDRGAKRRQRAQVDHDCRVFATLAAALAAKERPAGAIVCTATPTHFALASQLLKALVPTLVEKPIAATSAEGERLLILAAQQSTLLMVGHVERFNPAVTAVRRLVRERMIGEIIQL